MFHFVVSFGLLVLLLVAPAWSATLESPARGALLSGLGFISGWKCDAGQITVRINGGASMPVATHQPRQDTSAACGGATNNGYITQMNWALLGDGLHTIVVYDDVQFASATFEVVTLDQEFMRGADGVFEMRDFPNPGDVTRFEWNESTQHMEISEYRSSTAPVTLEPVHPARIGGRYPTRHVIHGFDVWVSPTVYDAPNYTPALLEQELDIVRAQLLWIVSHDALPPAAIRQIINSDLAIVLDTPSNPSAWWDCHEGVGAVRCYSPRFNRVGIPIVDAPYNGESYLHRSHTREQILLHEMAHVFHYEVIRGGFDNACITRHFNRIKARYKSVEQREQGTYGWFVPLDREVPMHERTPPGPWPPVEAYAATNAIEYFAEASCAAFGFNNDYPWNRNELWHHDPDGFRLVWEAWHDPRGFCRQ